MRMWTLLLIPIDILLIVALFYALPFLVAAALCAVAIAAVFFVVRAVFNWR